MKNGALPSHPLKGWKCHLTKVGRIAMPLCHKCHAHWHQTKKKNTCFWLGGLVETCMRDFQCSFFGVCLIEIQSRKYLKKKTFKRWCLNPKWFSDSLVTPRNGPSILGTFWRVQVDNMYIQSDFNQYIYIYSVFFHVCFCTFHWVFQNFWSSFTFHDFLVQLLVLESFHFSVIRGRFRYTTETITPTNWNSKNHVLLFSIQVFGSCDT